MLAERKPVAPSLLSDPAFSTDPQAHPYAVTSHEPWLSSPPAGHPTLKSKSRRRPADDSASDSEPIPPPNSPVIFADAPQNSTSFAVPNDQPDIVPSLGPHSLSSSSPTTAVSRSQEPYQSPSPSLPTTRPPATPKRRLTLMTLLKRRSYQQPQPTVSANPKPRKALTLSKSVPNRIDVTHPPISLLDIERQLFPPRPVTLGTSTPSVVPMPSTGRPTPKRPATDIPTNRYENLDRIDELDETNPWGVALHHGGPYEAAVQAIRGQERTIFPGRGSYNQGLPQNHDNNYLPPQATGLSLNLSPGQILPRNYHPRHTPPSQPVQNSMPPPPTAVMMKPPGSAKPIHPQLQLSRMVLPIQSSATLPVSSRRQSYQASPSRDFQSRPQSLNPAPTTSQVNLHTPSPLSSSSTMRPQHPPHRIPVAPQPSPNPPPVETHHNLPNRVTDDVSQMVSIGIGMAMLGDESDDDEESEESSSSAPSQPSTNPDGGRPTIALPLNPAVVRQSPPERTQPEIVTTSREVTSSSGSLSTQLRKTTLEEMLDLPPESPPPYTSPVQPKNFSHLQALPSQPSSTSSIQMLGSSVPRHEVVPMHANSQAAFVSTRAPPRASSVRNQPTLRPDFPRSYPPSRYSPERAGFEDTHSVHPSLSSKSSSSRSSGPPSSRRVPRNLVMPAPLAQSSVGSPEYQNRPPLAQLPPRRPTRHSLPHSGYPVLSPEPIPSTQIFVKAQAQEIHFASSKAGKLQKKVSLIGSPSHPPVITTVSFAPPIIGFNHSVGQEDDLRHMVSEKLVHKRVLSKRKNW